MNLLALLIALISCVSTFRLIFLPRSFAFGLRNFDLNHLAQAFFGRLSAVEDATRFEQLLADIANPVSVEGHLVAQENEYLRDSYDDVVEELMKKGRLESYKLLMSMMGDDDGKAYFNTEILWECVKANRMEYAEHMMAQGIETTAVIQEVLQMLSEYEDPEHGVDLLAFLIGRDPEVAEHQADIYHDAIVNIHNNWELSEDEVVELVRRLTGLGADVSDQLLEAFIERFPENVALHELLRNAQAPDCKGVEC
jgi:hypothetical protein